jgi:hypothetical protein
MGPRLCPRTLKKHGGGSGRRLCGWRAGPCTRRAKWEGEWARREASLDRGDGIDTPIWVTHRSTKRECNAIISATQRNWASKTWSILQDDAGGGGGGRRRGEELEPRREKRAVASARDAKFFLSGWIQVSLESMKMGDNRNEIELDRGCCWSQKRMANDCTSRNAEKKEDRLWNVGAFPRAKCAIECSPMPTTAVGEAAIATGRSSSVRFPRQFKNRRVYPYSYRSRDVPHSQKNKQNDINMSHPNE